MSNGMTEMGQSLAARFGRPARLMAVGVVALALLVPLAMVESVVRERHTTYRHVVSEIAATWSGNQRLAGPILVLPYTGKVEIQDVIVTPHGERTVTRRWETRERRAFVLPDVLNIEGSLQSEVRSRGIYRVQVFTADLVVSGRFGKLRETVEALSSPEQLVEIRWSDAVVAFGLSDPRGIVAVEGFELGGRPVRPLPGTTLGEVLPRGFHLPAGEIEAGGLQFQLPMEVRGSGSLQFLPLGETTVAHLRSGWPHPSFIGDVLPAAREISGDGFTAEWTIPLLSRSYPQAWSDAEALEIGEIVAGVRLFEPVALYDLVTRAVKYGLLFVTLTFLTLGLIELVVDVRLSLVQFLLVGVALAMFFLILIALAEHLGFAIAYVLAATTVVVMNSLYCAAILRRRSTAALLGVVLAAIYGVLYTILKAEDFALLGGTALLVLALGVTMYFTRRIHEPRVVARREAAMG